jgi:hypothetical protein
MSGSETSEKDFELVERLVDIAAQMSDAQSAEDEATKAPNTDT